MTAETIQFVVILGSLFFFLAAGLWVGVALLLTGGVGLVLFADTNTGYLFATVTWSTLANWTLTALPLFVWMGEILFRTRLSSDLFRGLKPFVQRLPGRLLHVNVFACGIFAAVSGSSAATTATIGRMTLPELARNGYDERLAIGSLAGSGTLGLLIPPSIMMIVYGVAAQVSINRLFIAGILPGIMLMALFSTYIAIRSLLSGEDATTGGKDDETDKISKLKALSLLAPTTLLIGFVIGSIYGGFATATEAAAIGVLGALVIAALSGALTRESFLQSISGALHTTAMIGLILIGAAFLTKAMSFTGLPAAITSHVVALHASPALFLVLMTLVFIVLGFFLDGISIIVLTSSVILPAIVQLGIDPIWFGIYLIIVVEMAQITPPLGINLFVIQGMTGHDIFTITRMTLPFFLLLLVAIVLLALFPGIATWLVDLKYN
jgi:tripartite ATP-independent transporter DctM subunit